ncbi:hypothetical protein, partial [Mesorhizobium sp.]|uniref:hypothetical protein n=1 Tax=Mesorhizobium sp. TaxID=1871066 RepID=UPI0025BC08FC
RLLPMNWRAVVSCAQTYAYGHRTSVAYRLGREASAGVPCIPIRLGAMFMCFGILKLLGYGPACGFLNRRADQAMSGWRI